MVNGAALNLAIGIIGDSVLTMPSAFQGVGLYGGLLLVAGIGALTVVSIRYLCLVMEKLQLFSYEDICRELLGPFEMQLARWMLFLFNFGECVGYVLICGQLLEPFHTVVPLPWNASPRVLTALYWACVLLPLCMVRKMKMLEIGSSAAMAVVLLICAAVTFRYYFPELGVTHFHEQANATLLPGALPQNMSLKSVLTNFTEMEELAADTALDAEIILSTSQGTKKLLSMPIVMFAFDCQALVFQVYQSFAEPSREVMYRVALRSMLAVSLVYCIVGTFGYLSFGDGVPDNILRAYDPKTDPLFALVYALYFVPVTLAYALVMFPVRDVIINVWLGVAAGQPQEDHVSRSSFGLITLVIATFTCLMALIAPQLDVVFGLLGGMCSSMLCFYFPAAFRLCLVKLGVTHKMSFEGECVAWGMVVLGLGGAIIGTWAGFMQLWAGLGFASPQDLFLLKPQTSAPQPM